MKVHQQIVTGMGGCLYWTMWKPRWQETLVFLAPRLIVQLFLLAAFLHFFGFPAVARFAKKCVMVVETEKDTDGIPFPALTLVSVGQITDDTCFWKNESIEDCIEENTLNLSDIIKSSHLGFTRQKKISLTQEFVREDFTSVWAGRYYTLNLPMKIGPNSTYQFFLGLNSNLTCSVFVHDPKYFIFNFNPIALPSIMRKFTTTTKKPNSWYYSLQLTEVNKLNLPSSPCNDDHSYNFHSCLRRSISAKVFACCGRKHSNSFL